MTISKLESGRFRVRVKQGRVVVASSTFDRLTDARNWEAEQKRLIQLGSFIDPRASRVLFGTLVAEFNEFRKKTVGAHSYETDEANLRLHVVPRLGKKPLGTITEADFLELWADLMQTHSRGTVSRIRDATVSLCGYAIARRLVAENIAGKAKLTKGSKRSETGVRPFTPEVLATTIETQTALNERYALVVEFLSLSGLRWGELRALRLGDVHLKPYPQLLISRSHSDGFEVKATKSNKPRRVPLVPRAAEIIELFRLGKRPGDALFTAPAGGMLNGGNFKRTLKWAVTAGGHRIHDLRHTAATGWLRAGIDVKTVSAWLGHADSTITLRVYAHYMGSDSDLAAVARLVALSRGTHVGHDTVLG